jgi:hypothetical protein
MSDSATTGIAFREDHPGIAGHVFLRHVRPLASGVRLEAVDVLDFDDFRAKVSEDLGGERPRPHDADVERPDPRKRGQPALIRVEGAFH